MAIVMGVFGVTCLGVLVVVVSIEEKSALSTVALALAILAFSIQLIVFVAQQSLAMEQARRNEELYGLMQAVLAEINEKAAGTQAEVRTINEKMLGAILPKYLVDVPGEERSDPEEVAAQVAHVVSQLEGLSGGVTGGLVGQSGSRKQAGVIWPTRQPTSDDTEHLQKLLSFPSETEMSDALDVLQRLPATDRIRLKRFGDDEVASLTGQSPFDPAWGERMAGNLEAPGFVEPYPPERQPTGGFRLFHLTDRGRDIARLLTAPGEPPNHLRGLGEIRRSIPDLLF